MDKIKDKLHKDKGIEISKVYIHSKYEENVLDLQSEKNALIIKRMDYSLLDMLIKNKKSQ